MTSKFRKLILQIIAGILGIWLASQLINGVEFTDTFRTLCYAGLILGLINFFIKPVLNLITLPLRILTFGLFSLLINMGIVWAIEIFFEELSIAGLYPLFLAFPARRGCRTSRWGRNNVCRSQGRCAFYRDSFLWRSAILGAARGGIRRWASTDST